MAKKTKTKEPKKTLATKGLAAPIKNAEEVTVEEVKNPQIEDAKKTGEFPPTSTPAPVSEPEPPKTPEAPADPEPPQVKNPEPITPEVVEPEEKKKEETPVPSISAGLSKLAKGDRLDHNHSVDLMKMVHEAYVGNPATPPQLAKAMKHQFDAMALVELMFYNAQLEADFQQLGVKVNQAQFTQMEQLARDMFGITLKGLPAPEDPKQMIINFPESIPQEIKTTVKEDLKAKSKMPEIPEPDPKMPEDQKVTAMRAIMAVTGKGIGNNIDSLVEWARKAYSFDAKERKATVLAFILQKDFKTTLTNCMKGLVYGKLNKCHSVLPAHALLHNWLPRYTDEEISEIVRVSLAYKEESAVKEFKERTGRDASIDNGLALLHRDILAGNAKTVADAVLKNIPEVVVQYPDKTGSVRVDTAAVRNSLITYYGESIVKDKIQELVKYYVKPLARLAKYVDKSAYSA